MFSTALGTADVYEMIRSLAGEIVDLAFNTVANWMDFTNTSGDAAAPLNASVDVTADTIQLSLDTVTVTIAGVKMVPMVFEALLSGIVTVLTSS